MAAVITVLASVAVIIVLAAGKIVSKMYIHVHQHSPTCFVEAFCCTAFASKHLLIVLAR